MKARWLAAVLLASGSAAGCGDDPMHVDGQQQATDLPQVPCPDWIPEFVATPSSGLEVTGRESGLIVARIVDADYSPPRKFRNDWTVLFQDVEGRALGDIEVTDAESYMTVHGHDGKFPPFIEKLEEPGVVFFRDINMHMGGPWEVRFWVESEEAGGADYIVFDVCINDD